jgi:hypothetical protein
MLSSSGFNAVIACCRLDGCRSEKKLSWLVAGGASAHATMRLGGDQLKGLTAAAG